MLNKLKSKLSSKDRKMREQQFEDAERFIKGVKEESGHRNGKLSRTEKQKMCEWISKFGADLPSLQ